jgi:hypothetical protein
MDILEEFEGGTEVDFGLVFNQGDDEKGRVVFQADTLNGIGVPFLLVQGEEAFGEVLYVFRVDVLEDVDRDEIIEELNE